MDEFDLDFEDDFDEDHDSDFGGFDEDEELLEDLFILGYLAHRQDYHSHVARRYASCAQSSGWEIFSILAFVAIILGLIFCGTGVKSEC